MSFPVDAVITWVDGADDAHKTKLSHYFSTQGIPRSEAAAPTRFQQCGEIDHCVYSLLRNAPWVRTIYIVTDEQIPSIMKRFSGTAYESKLKLVDHRDIFKGYESVLPTFNSMTIESMIWRIEGLSDHFIYLNDDCFIIRPVMKEDFFRGKNIVIRGDWRKQSRKRWSNYIQKFKAFCLKKSYERKTTDLFRSVQEQSAQLAGWSTYFFQFPHAPFGLKKVMFEEFFLKHPEALACNLSHTIRDPQQFWILSLLQHLEIKKNNVVFDQSIRSISVHGGCHSLDKIQHRLTQAEKKKNVAFLCMQSIDEAKESTQKILLKWLEKKIPLDVTLDFSDG
jgi:hypothetical protein